MKYVHTNVDIYYSVNCFSYLLFEAALYLFWFGFEYLLFPSSPMKMLLNVDAVFTNENSVLICIR